MADDDESIKRKWGFNISHDTVWGIGGCIHSKKNYDEINIIKKINTNKPVSILFFPIDHIREYFELPKIISDNWMESFFKLETTLGSSY